MKYWFICFTVISHSLLSLTLREKLSQAEPGSYIVTEQNQLVSFLHLHSKKDHSFIFEEVSIPLHQSKNISWSEWIEKGAPGHTSWILYEVDMKKQRVTECYSLARKAWIPTEEINAFLIPLISLDLHYLSKEERLQKGATAKPGAINSRPWEPLQFKHGKKVKDPQYDVYTAKWPHDSSALAGKHIVLYFDQNEKHFPFPYWLQVRDGALKFKMRAIDSGVGLTSPISGMPRRKISFIKAPRLEEKKLCLTLNAPDCYDTLELYAIDLTAYPKTTHALSYEKKRKKECLSLLIDQEQIDQAFIKGHEYLWVINCEDLGVTAESSLIYTH